LHIERAVRAGLTEGFRQVVVLGGGLDTLALRLHREFPLVNFIELDHPATQAVKGAAIKKFSLCGENLNLLAADFASQSLKEILLSRSGYNPEIKTIFICEGVMMYLDENDVEGLFGFIKNQSGASKRFIFTFMEPDTDGNANFRNSTFLVRLWLRWKNEPFKWGWESGQLKDFLAARGFSLVELATAETFRQIYLRQCVLEDYMIAEGENICICENTRVKP
jgi:methyltransferase (TIGR00027 family)